MPADLAPVQPPAHTPLRAPSKWALILEQRVFMELGAQIAAAPVLALSRHGDKSPVLVMPGFTATDASTALLRSYIRGWGHWAHGWRVGTNLGPTSKTLAAIRERLEAVHARHGRPVTVIGQSGGGMFARYLAREQPEMVRQVITLGAPIQIVHGDRSSVAVLSRRLERGFDPEFDRVADHQRGVLPVPATSIYTRSDGIVRWQVCLDVVDDRHENVEVHATHSGLAVNPASLHVIADRLRQRDGDWHPFLPVAVAAALLPAIGLVRHGALEPSRHRVTGESHRA